MIRLILPLIAAALLIGCQQTADSNATAGQADQWKLVWSDEFDGPGVPDASKWTYAVGGHGWGNKEKQ